MYLTDPTALTVTGKLPAKDEELKKQLEEMKQVLEDMKPIILELAPLFTQLLTYLIPVFAWLTKIGLYININFLSGIFGLITAFQKLGDSTVPLKEKLKGILEGLNAILMTIAGMVLGGMIGGVPGAILGGIAGSQINGLAKWAGEWISSKVHQVPEFTQDDINKQLRFDGLPTTSNMSMLPSQLTQTNSQTTTVYSNPKIYIDAKNKTDEEMIGLFKSALNGDMDNINRQINQGVYSSPVKQGG